MSTSPLARPSLSLEEFLRLPGIEEPPGLEYVDGRVEEKAMPTPEHIFIAKGLVKRLDRFFDEDEVGVSFFELRHTFGGRSILPDVSVLLAENLDLDEDGRAARDVRVPPDVHVEVVSPEQSVADVQSRILHSMAHGCPLGILIHPDRRTIDAYRPGRVPERLPEGGSIDFAPVLPGLVIPVAEVFSWMTPRFRRPGAGPA